MRDEPWTIRGEAWQNALPVIEEPQRIGVVRVDRPGFWRRLWHRLTCGGRPVVVPSEADYAEGVTRCERCDFVYLRLTDL